MWNWLLCVVVSIIVAKFPSQVHASLTQTLLTATPSQGRISQSDLCIDPATVSISGISSGADLVVQLQVAYSSLFVGVGVFAGQSYHCAVHKFPDDPIVPINSTKASINVPYCDGCPRGETLAVYDHCKKMPNITSDPTPLLRYARTQAAAGTIDALTNLSSQKKNKRAFLYRGLEDECYHTGAVNATANFFRALFPPGNVYFENRINSSHLLPGIDPFLCWWEEWQGPDNCTFDGAGSVLRWIYGADSLINGRNNNTIDLAKMLKVLDQTQFFPDDGRDPLMDETAQVFVPPECMQKNATQQKGCKMHMFFHGCGVSPSYPVFVQFGGFLEWAANNSIVVVFPKMAANKGSFSQERSGCWDGYGQTGHDYDLRTGSQMITIANMVKGLTSDDTNK